MEILSEILRQIGVLCISLISSIGYPGIVFLMILESMIFPIPSELVMPFAGFLIAEGKMTFFWVIFSSTIGSLIGSLLSYYLGLKGGKKFLYKHGKYVLLSKKHLIQTERWFSRKGELTIFIGRFIPVVRHIISIPAGIGKMDIKKFSIYTLLGAGMWNFFLIYIGFVLGNNWEKLSYYLDYLSWGVLIILIGFIVYFIIKGLRNKLRKYKNLN